MVDVMKFDEHNSVVLYHYFKELSDALRPVLNTKNYEGVDQDFWIEKLSELKTIINGIIYSDQVAPTPEHNDLENIFNGFIPVLKTYQDNQLKNDLFKAVLQETLKDFLQSPGHLDESNINFVVESTMKITRVAYRQITEQF